MLLRSYRDAELSQRENEMETQSQTDETRSTSTSTLLHTSTSSSGQTTRDITNLLMRGLGDDDMDMDMNALEGDNDTDTNTGFPHGYEMIFDGRQRRNADTLNQNQSMGGLFSTTRTRPPLMSDPPVRRHAISTPPVTTPGNQTLPTTRTSNIRLTHLNRRTPTLTSPNASDTTTTSDTSSSEELPTQPTPRPPYIRIVVLPPENSPTDPIPFKIRRTTPLERLMDVYCRKTGKSTLWSEFFCGDVRVVGRMTAEELGLEKTGVLKFVEVEERVGR